MVLGSLLLIAAAVVLLGYGLVAGSNVAFVASIAASLLAAVALIVGARQAAAARLAEHDAERDGERDADQLTGDGGWLAPEEQRQRVSVSASGGEFAESRGAGADQTAYLPAVRGDDGPGDRRRGDDRYLQLNELSIPTQHGAADVNRDAAADDDADLRDAAVRDAAVRDADLRDFAVRDADLRDADLRETHLRDADLREADGEDDDDDDDEPLNEPPAQEISASDAARVATMHTEVVVVDGRPRYHKRGCVHLLGRSSEPIPVSEAVELGFTPCSLCEPDSALLADLRRV